MLTSGDGEKDSLFGDEPEDLHPEEAGAEGEASSSQPGPADASTSAAGPSRNNSKDTAPRAGHRDKVNKGVFALLRAFGTPGADRFADDVRSKKYYSYPLVPGEKDRNPNVTVQREEFNKRQATILSRRASFSSINPPTFDPSDAGREAYATASGSGNGPPKVRSMSTASLGVPHPVFPRRHSTHPSPHASQPSSPPSHSRPSTPSTPPTTRSAPPRQSTQFLEVPTRHETLPPQAERADPSSPERTSPSRNRSPSFPIPTIKIMNDTDSDTSRR